MSQWNDIWWDELILEWEDDELTQSVLVKKKKRKTHLINNEESFLFHTTWVQVK